MTIAGGGAISTTTISDEFGGTKPNSLSEYYKGGGLVPALAAGNIPTSGPIALGDFHDSSSILPPPIAIGELLIVSGDLGSSGVGEQFNETFNFNALHDDATYRIDWYMTASAAYGFTAGSVLIYKNGVLEYNGFLPPSGTLGSNGTWFRDYSGQKNISSGNFTWGFGDSIQMIMSVSTRDSNAYATNHTAFYAEIERIA